MNNSSDGPNPPSDIIYEATNLLSLPVCILAVILVLRLKLYRIAVYRLALYQVLASLLVATIQVLEIIFLAFQNNPWPDSWREAYARRLCIAIAWLQLYSFWLKILFTMWVAFHLFCFAVLHRNMKKLEVMYVITSLLVPALVSCVPLVTHSYGFSRIDGCYIPMYGMDYTVELKVSVIENFSLLDAPAMAILLGASLAMIIMLIKLSYRVCWRMKYEPITGGDQFQEALKQVLPLAAFPIFFFIFVIPVLMFDIIHAFGTPKPNRELAFTQDIFITFWSLSSGVAVIVHICLAAYCARLKKKPEQVQTLNSTFGPTVGLEPALSDNSATICSLPNASLADE